MDIYQALGLIAAIFIANLSVILPLFLWLRSEANSDRREFASVQKEDRRELLQISRNLELTLIAIQQEMKDFHGRMCAIEERKKV